MKGDLLALDPSIVSPGVALFRDGVLVAAARLSVPKAPSTTLTTRACAIATRVVTWLMLPATSSLPCALATEWPQIYIREKSKGDPNDLIAMAAVVGAVAERCAARWYDFAREDFDAREYLPAEWIGQVPKATRGKASLSPRALRILSRLSPAERALIPDQHDAIDAVGIGLHHLGRLGVRRVYSNGADA